MRVRGLGYERVVVPPLVVCVLLDLLVGLRHHGDEDVDEQHLGAEGPCPQHAGADGGASRTHLVRVRARARARVRVRVRVRDRVRVRVRVRPQSTLPYAGLP